MEFWNYPTKNGKNLGFSHGFSRILTFSPPSVSSFPIEKTQKEAHGKAKERQSVTCAEQKIDRRRPKKKEKQERAKHHTPLCQPLVSKTAKQTFQHPPAVKGANGQEIEQSQHKRRAGKHTRRLPNAPQRCGNRRTEQADERPRRAKQPLLAIGEQIPVHLNPRA